MQAKKIRARAVFIVIGLFRKRSVDRSVLGQGQAIIQAVVGQLQQQFTAIIQQAFGHLTGLLGSIGGRFDFANILALVQPFIDQAMQGLMSQLTGGLTTLIGGGRAALDVKSIFSEWLASLTGQVTAIGQHLLNQGLGAVLGSLGGSRGLNDLWAALTQQLSGAVSIAQGVLSGALGNLSTIGAGLIDASKPHWEQLQENLVGHGLNVLGSVSETINNLHGSITSGR